MESNKFELKIDKALTKLSGFELGKELFDEQLKDIINYENNITIIIPNRVDLIASSFIQGFFEDVVNKIGISGIEEKVRIISSIPDAKNMIIDNLN